MKLSDIIAFNVYFMILYLEFCNSFPDPLFTFSMVKAQGQGKDQPLCEGIQRRVTSNLIMIYDCQLELPFS